MIFRQHPVMSLALTIIATTSLSAPAVAAFPHFGAKKQQDPVAVRKLTPSQSALVDRAITREHAVVMAVKDRAPIVETYIQNMRPDPVLTQRPVSDRYFLDRVEISKAIGDEEYQINPSTAHDKSKRSGFSTIKSPMAYFSSLRADVKLQYIGAGFVQMLLVDPKTFDRSHYVFSFVQNRFLGNIPTAVFDVTPPLARRTVVISLVGFGSRRVTQTSSGSMGVSSAPFRSTKSTTTSTVGARTSRRICGCPRPSMWKRATP